MSLWSEKRDNSTCAHSRPDKNGPARHRRNTPLNPLTCHCLAFHNLSDCFISTGDGQTENPRNNHGMALVLTLMVVTLVTAMVVEFAYGVYVSTSALHNWQTSQQLSLAARSATQLGSRLIVEKKALEPNYTYPGVFETSQKIPFEELEGTISIRIEDEAARFNINTLVYATGAVDRNYAYPAFIRLLKALELKPDIADRIVDWIDPDNIPNLQGAEDEAKNGYLDSMDELLTIPGIDKETFERLQPYVTIYGSNVININTAGVPVLRSLPGDIDKSMAENIVHYRELTPLQIPTDILKVAGFKTVGNTMLGRFNVYSNTFRIIATATSGDIKRIIESVVAISGTSRSVLYWREY
ncbi:MAG: hypothetical protein C0402_06290 [Thermodesulfovibrio sp.]|nr:hypothetical protein [Thermodesulfovibrio sp.]